MLIYNNLENYIHRFPGLLLEHNLRLNDITGKNVRVLTDDEMLVCNEAFPNKFELEVVRFWRKKNLLPFFEEGKHAKISLAQLMWLRLLSNLRNLSPNVSVLESAHVFFLKNAYDKNLALRNLMDLEEKLKTEIKNHPEDSITKEMLDNVTKIIKDPLLQYSLKIDINYFNMYVMDEIINAPDSKIIFTYRMINEFDKKSNSFKEIPKFEIIKNDRIVSVLGEENKEEIKFDIEKSPVATFYANYFLRDIFADCNISEKAFNIKILNAEEQVLFKEIRNKKLVNVSIQHLSQKIGKKTIPIMSSDGNYNKEGIKELKLILGTKNYINGVANLNDGTKYSF